MAVLLLEVPKFQRERKLNFQFPLSLLKTNPFNVASTKAIDYYRETKPS